MIGILWKLVFIFKLFVFLPVPIPSLTIQEQEKLWLIFKEGIQNCCYSRHCLIALIGRICLLFLSLCTKAQSTKRCMEIIFLYSISEGPNDFNLWKYLWGILKKSALMRGRKYWNTWRCRKAFFKRNFQISSNIWGRRPPQPHSCTACNPWTHDSNEASTHPSNFF